MALVSRMFDSVESATPEKHSFLWASLRSTVSGVACFFTAFFFSLVVTIPWSNHYWAGDGQAVLGELAVSFYFAIACSIGVAIYTLRRATRGKRS